MAHDERLMLLDSASLYFRAFYGVPQDVTAPDGTLVNAARGFLDMIATLVEGHRPTQLVACWDDDWRPAWRVELLPSYKTQRLAAGSVDESLEQAAGAAAAAVDGAGVVAEETPDGLAHQVPLIADLLAALGIARVGAPRCEADDVIGTLTTRAPAGTAVDIVTGDRDLFQLVDDARRVQVLYVAKGVRNRVAVDEAELFARYGIVSGPAYADLATLRGDASDGLPGVAGIGEKTAATLLRTYGDLAAVLAAAADPSSTVAPAQRRKLLAADDYLAVAPEVVRVLRDADLPRVDPTMPRAPADPSALDRLADRYGLGSSVQRVLTALAG